MVNLALHIKDYILVYSENLENNIKKKKPSHNEFVAQSILPTSKQ